LRGKGDIWQKSARSGVNLPRLSGRLERMLSEMRKKPLRVARKDR
jgi:hypothetical protein